MNSFYFSDLTCTWKRSASNDLQMHFALLKSRPCEPSFYRVAIITATSSYMFAIKNSMIQRLQKLS